MSVVTWVKRRSKLSTLINAPGGVSVGAALRAADANLAPLRARGLEVIADQIKAVEAARQSGEGDAAVQAVYRASSGILDAASPFGLNDICTAAYNLCEIADAHPAGKPFDWRVVDVHVRAMSLLMSLPDSETAARAQVLEGLQQVAARKIGA